MHLRIGFLRDSFEIHHPWSITQNLHETTLCHFCSSPTLCRTKSTSLNGASHSYTQPPIRKAGRKSPGRWPIFGDSTCWPKSVFSMIVKIRIKTHGIQEYKVLNSGDVSESYNRSFVSNFQKPNFVGSNQDNCAWNRHKFVWKCICSSVTLWKIEIELVKSKLTKTIKITGKCHFLRLPFSPWK